ncbi:preprotein translocase subunit SecG [Candidatus Falkowbacteria bacterium]|nr:preprotein translocase subunit SecG [Candidatus Falkowbacteria bacterium]
MIIDIIQIVSAVLLIIAVLMQSRGAGLGSAFGASDGSAYQTKRGAEKGIFYFTIILSIVFLVTAFINILL